ncbi:energy-coupling factor ABC transporter permease [Methanocella arvoryzae]|uniref:Cobalamin biosyntheis protein M n=1 Tax=Methanocella arvoryzae (strain DSM 22066 / NBRC 105507 / MRE50) TaxID=351160 RepID=Q0W7Y6_METAR|nr:energy-coupling factor ABC transporter permease [Methanocella arvoryzae]CAJ35507.1 putative cobalamin biosyntheis protein M [Methanocella arvoryzae MRE50]
MAHIHLEDGSFYLQWVIIWTIIALVIIGICIFWLRNVRKMDSRLMTLAALCTAAAFAVFQIEIPVFGGVHLSLTPLIGILAGPAVGGVIVLIVNVFSAAIGHEGWGIIGANAIVNMAEIVGAFLIYTWLTRSMKMRALYSAGIATFLGLFLGNAVMIGIILVSGIQGKDVVLAELSLVAAANIAMAVIEAFVTAYIVAYIQKVRPDMLGVTRVAERR